ncbi:50S ribosomal protein L22 [Hordeum vulgare]|nr:50S ribosomal protein L22 [Hordeum vulgare]
MAAAAAAMARRLLSPSASTSSAAAARILLSRHLSSAPPFPRPGRAPAALTDILRPAAVAPSPSLHQLIRNAGISSTRSLLAGDDSMVPVSSPLSSPMGAAEGTDDKGAVVKRLKVQAIKKDIKQSPKKVNLVAKLVRGMRVEDALLQLQVTVKRAAKTLYQVIHSARANAAHNHGLDADKLIVEEAFVGKGIYLKRLAYHAKGRCGVRERPRCRLTVVVREATAEEEAKIAKLRVMNYKKLTRKEKQLMPHRLIEVSPKWARKRKEEEEAGASA